MSDNRNKTDLAFHCSAILLYCFAFIILTFPLVIHLNRAFFGSLAGYKDLPLDIWLQWFVFSSIKAGKSFLYSSVTNYPVGLSLFDNVSGFFIPVTAAIPRFFLNQFASYNLTVFVFMVASAYAGYLLARYLVKDNAASLLAGFIFGFNPFVLNEAMFGRLIVAAGGWVALYVLSLYKILHGAGRRYVVIALLVLMAAFLTSMYYGFFLVLFTGVFVIAYGFTFAPLKVDWKLTGKLASIIAGFVFFILVAYRSHVSSIDGRLFYPGTITAFSGNGIPSPMKQIALQSLDVNPVVRSAHLFPEVIKRLSVLTLLFSVIPLLFFRKKPAFLAISAAVFFILALGPFLRASGNFITVKNHYMPMPYLLFFCYFPCFARIHWPERFLMLVMLSLSLLSAYGFQWITDELKITRGAKYAALAVAVLALIIEMTITPLSRVFPAALAWVPVPVYYQQLSREQGDFAILQYPFGDTNYLYYQTVHHKKIFDSQSYLTKRYPAAYTDFINKNSFLSALQKLQETRDPAVMEVRAGDLKKLKDAGFRYIVVDSADRALTGDLVRSLDAVVGIHTAYPDGIIVFRL